MRLRKLSLDRFGRFTGKSYDFGSAPDSGDFHVIYGPNEAGKTTTMEGFLRLLYGFPLQDGYAFQHQRKNLSISGTLEIDGATRHFTRLPQRDGALTDENGVALPENAMTGILGGLDETEYRKLLCLDDETIEKGGEEIASSKGDIGRLLFSAAAGISDLTAVLDQVQTEANELHRARASKTRFALLKKEREALEKQIKELDVPASAYRKLKQAFDSARSEEAALSEQRSKLRQKRATAETQAAAIPLLTDIDRLEAALEGTSDYPEQLDINPEELVSLIAEQSTQSSRKDAAAQAITNTQAQLEAVERLPQHLSLGNALVDLEDLRTRHLGAARDLGRRQKEHDELSADMAAVASRFGAGSAPVNALLVDDGSLQTLEDARTALRDAKRSFEAETSELRAVKERLRQSQTSAPKTSEDATDWSALLDQHSAERLATSYATAKHVINQAERAYSDALATLAVGAQQFETAPIPPLTSDTAETLAETIRDLLRKSHDLKDAISEQRAEVEAKSARIAHLKAGSGVIGDATAAELKDRRDALWRDHCDALTAESAKAFERAMRELDDASDKRLGHARDLGELRQIEADLAEATVRLRHQTSNTEQVEQDLNAAKAEVADACSSAGLNAPLDPATFAKWIKLAEHALLAEHTLQRARDEHAETLKRADQLTSSIAEAASLIAPDFEAALETARKKAAEQSKEREARQTYIAQTQSLKADLAHRENMLTTAKEALTTAQTTWASGVSQALGEWIAPEALEASLSPLQDLQKLEIKRQQVSRQIAGMTQDQEQFLARLQELAASHGTEVTADADNLFQTLRALATQATEADERFEQLTKQLQEQKAAQSAAKAEIARIDQRVTDLAAIFPASINTSTLADLRRAVATAETVLTHRESLARAAHTLNAKLRVTTVAEARACLSDQTAEGLTEQIDQLDRDIDALETSLSAASAERGRAEHALRGVTGDSDIAALTERKSTIELELQEVAKRHLELRLGHRLAEEAIRRYRDTHRSGMMQSAEATFAALTNNAYVRLDTVPAGQTETLIAYDAAGQAKQAKDMSKGTRFQLYLALRAAAYEQLAAQGQTLPFFCDDIFETFDEDRTRSACQVMARIGQTGQAIYLTHHKHVVDLAQEVCGPGVQIHTI